VETPDSQSQTEAAAARGKSERYEPRSETEALLLRLEAASAAQAGIEEPPVFRGFLRRYYEMASLDTLKQRDPAQLLATALEHYRFARRRSQGETLVQVVPPAEGGAAGEPALAIVRSCMDDQPFLVDTVMLAIRNAGASVDWSVHPVMRALRDASGVLQGAADIGQGPSESLIHLEFEPLADPVGYASLEEQLRAALADLQRVAGDYGETLRRLRLLVGDLKQVPPWGNPDEFSEAAEFLTYLDHHHFTFLGYMESRAQADAQGRIRLVSEPETGLGLLRPGSQWASEDLIAPQAELDKYAISPRVVVVTKANLRSPVHRGDLMDVVAVKRFDPSGVLVGTVRFVGLFSADVYIDRPRQIPLIRRKAEYVVKRSRLSESSHSGKNLRDIIHGLPRDELFQSGEEELYRLCMGIRALRDRHHLRLFMRRDRYGRFFSCLVYLPRERYSREMRDKIAAVLGDIFGSLSVDHTTEFLRGGLTRVHYIVRTPPGTTTPTTAEEIESRLIVATRSWRDQLRELLLKGTAGERGAELAARDADAFPLGYTETAMPAEAAADVACLVRLSPSAPLLPRLGVAEEPAHAARPTTLKLYALHNPVALSDVLPALENFGLKVIRQEPAQITPQGTGGEELTLWVQEFEILHPGSELPAALQQRYFEDAFVQVWRGEVENDGLNRLVLGAGLDARQVTLLRAVCKYLIQTGIPYSQAYIETLLGANGSIARLLVGLFERKFAPGEIQDHARRDEELRIGQELDHALDQVASLDGDRVLRAFLSVIRAMLRTNYYQPNEGGHPKHYLSFKIDPAKVPELPLPRPKFEIWVYAPEVEGVHLRGGKVARGGLRWSDRPADFRTEILGLMKAQMVKNTVIVPVGAKGGFVVKKPVDAANRDAWMKQGIACYRIFLRGLLDITDNRIGDALVPPAQVIRYDDDDPYLVVAADKGTATFSDIANGVAGDYGFWLGDAFASGGSAGYDHKKMGITARGAWESVKRHFRELPAAGGSGSGRDIQNEAFTAAGIGDMSGDVFGNGMLLSRTMKLVAAFDHRHIFLDPNPDPQASFAERERLFALPRSSWADYNASLISAGGGVFPRSAKLIKLSTEAREVLGIAAEGLAPNELMKAILKAPVDLLWNGGIGTYVKAATQSHLDVGDRANDPIRVNGRELRCKVVGEGGNLGFTQSGRIEYALGGGKINTDAIDNAGGVHTSDREVNIKIPLNELMRTGKLTREQRDPLLASVTADIARFVLRDNYVQSAAISVVELGAPGRLDDHSELIHLLEREGLLVRALEFLPDEEGIKDRRTAGLGLTRPEIAVLVAYAKISLFNAVLESQVPDDPFFVRDLLANFPQALIERYRDAFAGHRLKREIIATVLCNALVNRMGPGFAHLWAEDHGLFPAEVLKAYATAHEVYRGDDYWLMIESLDNHVQAAVQYRLLGYAIGLLKHATGWFTESEYRNRPVQAAVDRFAGPVAELAGLLPGVLPTSYREDWEATVAELDRLGVPKPWVSTLANTRAMGGALDIAELAEEAQLPLAEAATAYFLCGEGFNLLWLYAAINDLPTVGKWQALARVNLRDDIYRLHRQLAGRMLQESGGDAYERVDSWTRRNERHVKFACDRLAELQATGNKDFSTLAVAVREIRKLRRL
jgi:glutamate dehydrogenase